jgi:hypothetical protein
VKPRCYCIAGRKTTAMCLDVTQPVLLALVWPQNGQGITLIGAL